MLRQEGKLRFYVAQIKLNTSYQEKQTNIILKFLRFILRLNQKYFNMHFNMIKTKRE